MATTAKKPPRSTEPEEETKSSNGAETGPDQVLDLTSLVRTRKVVKLPTKDHPEGVDFELRYVDDFGIEMQQRLLAWSRRFTALYGAEEPLTDAKAEEMRNLLEKLFDLVLEPTSLMGKDEFREAKRSVDDAGRHRVVQAFSWGPVLGRTELQTELVRRLIDKGYLEESQVDEVMEELRAELLKSTSES